MNLNKVLTCFALVATGFAAAAGLLSLSSTSSQAQTAVAIDNDDIGGVVRGPNGPEAGASG